MFHPVSKVFCPDLPPIWREAFRVLRPGGALMVGFMNPDVFIFDFPALEQRDELVAVQSRGVEPLCWYGVWLFVDWLEFSGAELDPSNSDEVMKIAAVELEASRRDPYRQLSRVFHLVGRKGPNEERVVATAPIGCCGSWAGASGEDGGPRRSLSRADGSGAAHLRAGQTPFLPKNDHMV